MTEPTENLQQRCAEIVEWQRTGVLSGSTLRNHAKTHWAGYHDSLQMAERDTFTKAVEWVAKWGTSPAVAGEPIGYLYCGGIVAISTCRPSSVGIRVWATRSAILVLRSMGGAAVGDFHAVLPLHNFVGQGVPHQLDRSPQARSKP